MTEVSNKIPENSSGKLIFNNKDVEIKTNQVKLFFKEFKDSKIYLIHKLNGENFLSHWTGETFESRVISSKKTLVYSDSRVENKLTEYADDIASKKEVKTFLECVGKFLKINYSKIFSAPNNGYDRSGKEKFLLSTFNQLKKFHIYLNKNTLDLCIYHEDEGVYRPYSEKEFSNFLKRETKTRFFENEVRMIMGLFNEFKEESKDYIAFTNCLLNLKTMETKTFTHKVFTIFKVPFEWNPNAHSEFFENKISEIFDDEAKLTKYLQMVGYCFFEGNIHNKIFLLIGEGANAKSTLLNLIEAIFEDTIAAVPLQDFSKEFGLQPLIDKKVNLLFDLPIETIHETGQIKAITGEDSITINRKYKDPITTKLKCKVIGAGNRLPLIKDDSFAFWRRIVILHLTKRFEGKNRDVKLKEKLINDKEGMSWLIYNSIKAYKEVEEIGWQEDTYKLVRESFLKESNPALYAAEKLFDITVEPDDFLSKKEITEKINAYLRDNKIKIPAKINEYYEAVKHVGAKLGQKTVKNQKIHGFRYIKQRNPQ